MKEECVKLRREAEEQQLRIAAEKACDLVVSLLTTTFLRRRSDYFLAASAPATYPFRKAFCKMACRLSKLVSGSISRNVLTT
jgi:hypothetical protein